MSGFNFHKFMDGLCAEVAATAPLVIEPSTTVPGRVVHIDADMLCYVGGGKEGTTVATSRGIVNRMVQDFIDHASAESAVLHMTASGSLKGDRVLMPIGYQNHRKSGRRPENWQYLRDWITGYEGTNFKVKTWFDREADDGFGWVSTSRPLDVICTNDKDMRMLPGLHLDWVTKQMVEVPKDCYELVANGKVYGYKWFLLQMLQGDTADGIRGIGKFSWAPRGVGDKTAEKFLKHTTTKEEGVQAVIELYECAFGDSWGYEFAQQAILLWIRRGKSALLDEFLAFTPMTEKQRQHVVLGLVHIKDHVKQMKDEAAALCR